MVFWVLQYQVDVLEPAQMRPIGFHWDKDLSLELQCYELTREASEDCLRHIYALERGLESWVHEDFVEVRVSLHIGVVYSHL